MDKLVMYFAALNLESIIDRIMPAAKDIYRSFNKWWLFVGCISLYGFVFLKLPAIAVSGFFHALMVLAFFVSAAKAPLEAKKDPAWFLIASAVLITLFIYAWSNLFFPEYAEVYPSTGKLLSLCQFFLIAWWLGGQTRNVLWLLTAALTGFIVWLLMRDVWSEFSVGFAGNRATFGMHNPQVPSIYFSVAFLGWVLFFRRIISSDTGRGSLVRRLIWVVGTVILMIGCVFTQTRVAWLGIVVALSVVAFTVLLYQRYSVRQVMTGFVITMGMSVALIYPMSDMISKRLGSESTVIHQILQGDADNVPYSSFGLRVHTWIEAWKWIKQRPVTGWGYGVREKVFSESTTLPDWVIQHIGHFHNSYIEILLSYGLIGIFFVMSIFYVIAWQAWLAWRSGIMPTDVFLFGLAFFIFWIIVNMTESYLVGRVGVYLTGLIGGCLYTFSLSERLKKQSYSIR
jgi:O-antigen ligase